MTLCYVPAGIEAYSERTAQIYIRNKPNKKETTEFGLKYKRWDTKERTIVETMSSKRGVVIPDEYFDLVIPIFSPTFIKACGLDLVLVNPEVGKDFKSFPYKFQGISSIVDSGGFQLSRSSVDFVHPDGIVKRYNADADIGMPLDLPVHSNLEAAYFNRVSHLIKANDDYIIPKLKPGIELALISHGASLERRIARLEVIDRPANVIAVAGLGRKPPPGVDKTFSAVENLMYVTSRYKDTARYFHVLGVTSKLWLFIYGLLDRANYVRSIGGDSVSHRLSALVGMYNTSDFRALDLVKNQTYKTIPPCNCPICTAVDDLRIIHSWRLLEAHNLWVAARQTEIIGEMAASYLKGTITLKEIATTMQLNIDPNKLALVVDYVLEVMGSKFKPLRKVTKTKNLFNNKEKMVTDAHYDLVIKNYEKFHSKKFPNS